MAIPTPSATMHPPPPLEMNAGANQAAENDPRMNASVMYVGILVPCILGFHYFFGAPTDGKAIMTSEMWNKSGTLYKLYFAFIVFALVSAACIVGINTTVWINKSMDVTMKKRICILRDFFWFASVNLSVIGFIFLAFDNFKKKDTFAKILAITATIVGGAVFGGTDVLLIRSCCASAFKSRKENPNNSEAEDFDSAVQSDNSVYNDATQTPTSLAS